MECPNFRATLSFLLNRCGHQNRPHFRKLRKDRLNSKFYLCFLILCRRWFRHLLDKMSCLNEIEKLHVRLTVVKHQYSREKIFKRTHLRQAIKNANKLHIGRVKNIVEKLKSASTLQRNCISRPYKRTPWIPSHFKARVLNQENS